MLATRVPVALAEAVRSNADRLGMTYSDYIANVLAERHGIPPVVTVNHEDQMKLTA